MFERFTQPARQTVITAQAECRRLHQPQIGSEHLLLALTLGPEDDLARRALTEFGLDHDSGERRLRAIRGDDELDAAALSTVGIDLEEVRRRVEAQFGPGALEEPVPPHRAFRLFGQPGPPFGADAKKSLELALREAIDLRHREIGTSHLLLGTLRSAGLAVRMLDAQGIQPANLRAAVVQQLRASA